MSQNLVFFLGAIIVKLQLISKLKSTQLNLNNLRDELGVDAIFTVPPTHH